MINKIRIVLILLLALAGFSAVLPTAIRPAAAVGNWPTCGAPTVITLAQMQDDPSSLTQISAPGDPTAKRSLVPPCSAYYELDGVTISSTYTGECGLLVTGVCDVHLQFNCTYAPGCLFEIDQTWLGAGYQYPRGCKTAGGAGQVGVCVSNGDIVSARGFFYIDDHAIHEFHPTSEIVKASNFPNFAFNYVVTILMENNGYCDIITTCGGSGTYETSLANTYAKAGACQSDSSCSVGGYTACCHFSQGNYVSLFAGGSNINSNTLPDGYCCYNLNAPNLVDRIESGGLTWQAWAEGATGSGCGFRPPRNADHFPFISFVDMNTAARCANFHATSSSNDNSFISMLSFANASSLMWLTPNDNNNGHDTGVSGGDNWLSGIVPRILASPLFSNSANKAALVILYDEGNSGCSGPCNTSTNDFIYVSWSGTPVKQGYIGAGHYTHASWAKTMETAWNLSCIGNTPLGAEESDCNALAMSEFFGSTAPPPANQFDCVNWNCANFVSPSTLSVDVNGTAKIRQSNPGTCDFVNSFYDSLVRGSPPPISGPAQGTPLPGGITSVSSTVKFLSRTLGANCTGPSGLGPHYNLFIAFYFRLAATVSTCTIQSDGFSWLDTQVRSEYIQGDVAVGSTFTYGGSGDPGVGACGYATDTANIDPGQTATLTANAAALCGNAKAAWGIAPGNGCTLMGVEIGTEGFDFSVLNTNWFNVVLATAPPPILTASFTFAPTAPITGQTVQFTASASGGTPPYAYAWKFGDGITGSGQTPSHVYSAAGTFTIMLNVTDSGVPLQLVSASRSITVTQSVPPNFVLSASPSSVTFNAGTGSMFTVTVIGNNGFTATVFITLSTSPTSGLSTICSPTSIPGGSGSSTCTMSSSQIGTYGVTVTGTSGTLVHTAAVTVTVAAAPDYTIVVSPASLNVQQGKSGTSTITLVGINGFAGTISLTVVVAPLAPSATPVASLSPAAVTLSSGGSGSSVLTITVGAASPVGSYNVNTTGTSGSLRHSANVVLSVFASPPPPPPAPPPQSGQPPGSPAVTGGGSTLFDTGVVGIALIMTCVAMVAVVFKGFKNRGGES